MTIVSGLRIISSNA